MRVLPVRCMSLKQFGDVVQPRIGDSVIIGDGEIVGYAVHGHPEVRHHILSAGTDLVRDDDPCAAGGQDPGRGGFVERSPAEIAVVHDRDVGDARIGESVLGAVDPHDDDVVAAFCHRGRKPVRRHSRRAIGPIRPTSSRNAASGAKPVA